MLCSQFRSWNSPLLGQGLVRGGRLSTHVNNTEMPAAGSFPLLVPHSTTRKEPTHSPPHIATTYVHPTPRFSSIQEVAVGIYTVVDTALTYLIRAAACGSNGLDELNHATAQMNHTLARQAAFHQRSIGAPISSRL